MPLGVVKPYEVLGLWLAHPFGYQKSVPLFQNKEGAAEFIRQVSLTQHILEIKREYVRGASFSNCIAQILNYTNVSTAAAKKEQTRG